MKTEICLKKLNSLVIENKKYADPNRHLACSLNAEFMRLGFVMSDKLMNSIGSLSEDEIKFLATDAINVLKEMKGADVNYTPMYPNFPKQVMEMEEVELYMNAILHYWTCGEWKPEYYKLPRDFELESHKLKRIDRVTEDEYKDVFTKLVSSNDSLSVYDKEIVEWFLNYYYLKDLTFPDTIPYKETMCIVAVNVLKLGKDITSLVKTSTDLLRIITYMSNGDISLSSNTKFKSLPRAQRKYFVKLLEKVISEEDIQRHRNKWGKLFHNLHVGEYSQKVYDIAKKVRENKKLYSINSVIHQLINDCQYIEVAKLLKKRPGDFARRLDHLLRNSEYSEAITKHFLEVAPKVSTRVLMQLIGHFNNRNTYENRVVFPKGNTQKAILIDSIKEEIDIDVLHDLIIGIEKVLVERFAELKSFGTTWIDERLKGCPLPTQQRSASDGADVVARGTRLPIDGDMDTLRLFIYWIGQDIDLSATFHDENFKMLDTVAYTNLKSDKFNAYHSGDITSAPNGAAEFIDIDMKKSFENGARYIAMNVLVYSGPTFEEHKKVYAGWMTRSKPNSNEIFDPKTVISKVDLVQKSSNVISVIFDLKTREAIWVDLTTKRNQMYSGYRVGNNVEANRASIQDVLKSITSLDNKPTLYDLFRLHQLARGVVVPEKEMANTVFDLEDGIGPRDINTINSEYLN